MTGNPTRELWQLTAAEIATGVRAGVFSAVEVARSVLDRVEACEPELGAVTIPTPELALHQASRVDRAVCRDEPVDVLAGVPVTIKENIDVAGQVTTDGVPAFADRRATEHSPVTANLLDAGAVLVGRTNTPEFSFRWHTANPLRGITHNPWSGDRTAGGSSGGAAAAVAAGMGAVGHGNDLGGSVRYPAYCCGVVGVRPTRGRIPVFTPTSGPLRSPVLHSMSVQGPLTRTVADARLALQAMIRPSPLDPHHVPLPLEADRPDRRRQALVAFGPIEPESAVKGSVELAGRLLADAGYEVSYEEPPHLREIRDGWSALLMNELRVTELAQIRSLASDDLNRVIDAYEQAAPPADLGAFIELEKRRLAIERDWAGLLHRYDVLVLPTSAELAIAPGDDAASVERCLQIMQAHTCLVALNYLGLPGVAVPTGIDPSGCPVGVQIVARRFGEDLALDAAQVLEQATGVLAERLWSA